MNSNKNDVDITKWTKASYFHCGLSTKNQKHQRQKENIERYIQTIKNICKLKW